MGKSKLELVAKIPIIPWRGKLTIVVGETLEHGLELVPKKVRKRLNPPPVGADLSGWAAFCISDGWESLIIASKKTTTISSFNHELLHVAMDVLKDRGVDYTTHSACESLTYLHQWLYDECTPLMQYFKESKPKNGLLKLC